MPPLDGVTILVVEDNEAERYLLTKVLAAAGASIIAVKNGEDALAQLTNRSADVLLIDLVLPDIDGLELLKRARPVVAAIPAIAITAHVDPTVRGRAYQAGFNAFVEKPIEAERLVPEILRHVRS